VREKGEEGVVGVLLVACAMRVPCTQCDRVYGKRSSASELLPPTVIRKWSVSLQGYVVKCMAVGGGGGGDGVVVVLWWCLRAVLMCINHSLV
jgi:hypothetical protein